MFILGTSKVSEAELVCGAETSGSATSCLATTTSVELASGEVGDAELLATTLGSAYFCCHFCWSCF